HAMQCALADRPVHWAGVDVNAAQVALNNEQAIRTGVLNIEFAAAPAAAWFGIGDSVAVLHVLEHTAYPTETLVAAEKYVAPHGHVVVVVPEDARAAEVSQADLDNIRAGVCPEERGHINSMTLQDLIALVVPRGRLLDASRIQTAPNNWDACVVYAPRGSV
ncbi:MAG: hypothetical protein Q8S13_06515, partial [Dehalococcoidia bacterium]|nr:hypothetical protein [Dehalococcoidia bacterium]